MNTSKTSQSHRADSLDRESWPIAAGLLPFPAIKADGSLAQLRGAREWNDVFAEVAEAGFEAVELTDTWIRAGDLTRVDLRDLVSVARGQGLDVPAGALIRRSILQAGSEKDNLAYSHRSIDAAAEIGARVVSVGLHEPLSVRQREALWFWTEPGARNDPQDTDEWSRAVEGLRALGRHASEVGVLLSLEMYEDTFLGTADSAVRLVEDIGLENVGLNPDIGNLIRLHRPVERWEDMVQKTLPYTNYWHVKNYLRDEDRAANQYFAVPSPLETGLINYRKAIADAVAAGFAGVITCEHYGGDGLGVSAANQRYLRSILPRRSGSVTRARTDRPEDES